MLFSPLGVIGLFLSSVSLVEGKTGALRSSPVDTDGDTSHTTDSPMPLLKDELDHNYTSHTTDSPMPLLKDELNHNYFNQQEGVLDTNVVDVSGFEIQDLENTINDLEAQSQFIMDSTIFTSDATKNMNNIIQCELKQLYDDLDMYKSQFDPQSTGKDSESRGLVQISNMEQTPKMEDTTKVQNLHNNTNQRSLGDGIHVVVPDISKEDEAKVMNWIKAETTSVSTDLCWKDSYGRGAGEVLSVCPPGKEKIGALCYSTCPTGFHRFGFDCHSTCPSSFRDDGLFCRHAEYGRGAGYPWKFGDSFNSHGMLSRCEGEHGHGKCEMWGAIAYPKCHIGYYPFGCCICRPSQPKCSRYGLNDGIDLSCGKKIIIGDPTPMLCPNHLEQDGALCYPKCNEGKYGVGPVCWEKCDSEVQTDCGLACTNSVHGCPLAIGSEVLAVAVVAANIATLGLASPVTGTVGETITIGEQILQGESTVGKGFVKVVNMLNSIDTIETGSVTEFVESIIDAKTGTVLRTLNTQRKILMEGYTLFNDFSEAYASDFVGQTSQAINDKIDQNFIPVTAQYLKKAWAREAVKEMAVANHWHTVNEFLDVVTIVDVTGITGLISAFVKPICEAVVPFPRTDASSYNAHGLCNDMPYGWHDSDGPSYDCQWYAMDENCAHYGNSHENMGKVANDACCACGGGGSSTSTSIQIISAGYTFGDYARIDVYGKNIIYPGNRGLNVVVMSEDGVVISNESFDTHASTQNAENFVTLISGLEYGTWVSIAVNDEAAYDLTTDAKNAIKSLGSNKIDSLGYRESWCIIGMKGAATGTVVENYNPNGVASCILPTATWKTMSGGYTFGNYARIEVYGKNIIYPGNRGLNVVVMSEDGVVISNESFDTHASTQNAENFVTLISGLEDGTWVSIAVKDEAADYLTTDAKNAIKSLGSNKIDSLGYRESWCIIGMKGAATGTVVEDYNPNGVASCIIVTVLPTYN